MLSTLRARIPLKPGNALALGIHLGLGSLPLLLAPAVMAQQHVQRYDIAPGALGDVLSSFARQAGVAISFEAGQVAGRHSAGLQGSYAVEQGFALLLGGQGLQALGSADGYVLSSAAAGDNALELGATTINSQSLGATTEGTGAYTTGATRTATKLNLSLRETPQSVSVMTRQRIEDQNLRSIGQVLEQTAGINVQSPGSDRLYVYSRGLAIDNYQYDGMPTTSFAFSQALPQALSDMAIYDHVEVVRGATGLLSGAGDPSGTVNLVRKKPTETFKGYVSAGLGSWDLYRTEVDVSGPLTDNGVVRGRAVAAYQQGNSFTDHLEQKKTILYGITEVDLSPDTLFTLGVDYLESNPRGFSTTGLPVVASNAAGQGYQYHMPRSSNGASRDSSNRQESVNTFASVEQKLAHDWTLKVAANYLYGTREYDSVIVGTTTGVLNPSTGDGLRYTATKGDNTQKQRGVDVMLSGPFALLGREHELVMGFNYQSYENRRNGFGNLLANGASNNGVSGVPVNVWNWDNQGPTPAYNFNREDDNIDQRQTGAYLATRLKPTDDLSLILGARVSNFQYDAVLDYHVNSLLPYSTDDSVKATGEVTPYAGVVYDLDEVHSLYASYTSIFKPQPYRTRAGKLLEPRQGDNYEIGLKSEYFGGRLNTAIALFEVNLDNDAVADGVVDGSDGLITAYRGEQTKTRGVDMEINGELSPGWNLLASYTHSQVEDKHGERVKTTVPMDMFKLWTTYQLPGALDKLTVGGGVNWQSSMQYTATPWQVSNPVKIKQDDYAIATLMARYQLTRQWSATATVNNLFDKQYFSALDQNFNSAAYGEPRNFMLSSKWEF
ncbi:Ferripyoverdine receptor [Pseudomonas reidholzensis]|uniref:Ferripyoverdine receptor n=1 Tax=Pseudomonas reidholzensis TaxID=1785162 RepID=A0A383S0R8_9PSED|nr:TonB-dependent siderophore receptor [Pseudomonas reidholzensis]SYX92593.1 Ferripyoverdine receptor [Pseudomonas reidholzensis]